MTIVLKHILKFYLKKIDDIKKEWCKMYVERGGFELVNYYYFESFDSMFLGIMYIQ